MLKDRLKQKAKTRAKQKVRQEGKRELTEAASREGAPKVLKAAAAGGAGYYAGKKISEQGQEDQIAASQDETYAPSPPPEAADTGSDMVAQLQQLAQLHDSGVLTDEEFASAKQKLLANG
jgi:hypothetical protein